MQHLKFSVPYKYKFILFLILLIVVTLFAFLAVSQNSYQNDKMSYIFDYILNTNQAKVQNFDAKIKDIKSSVSLYIYNKKNQVSLSESIEFVGKVVGSEVLPIYRTSNSFTLSLDEIKTDLGLNEIDKTLLFTISKFKDLFFLCFKHPIEHNLIFVGFKKNLISELFDISEAQLSVLLIADKDLENIGLNESFINKFKSIEPGKVTPSNIGPSKYLIVSSSTETTGQKFITALREKDLFEFTRSIRNQNIYLALLIISISSIFGILFSRKLTNSINDTIDAANEVSQGNYDIGFKKIESGEVGVLQSTIVKMASDIKKSLFKERDLARLENELKIARLVQQNFFSHDYKKTEKIEISGFYEPATECGGDWWGFFEIEHYHYFLIGDATGHGASSALMTAKAYSLVNSLRLNMEAKKLPVLTPSEIMDNLNQVFTSSNQVLMMTFFILRLDSKNMTIEYANASHEFPIGLSKNGEIYQLMEKPQHRLGHKKDTVYKNYSYELKENDILILYTDGLVECSNQSEQAFGIKRAQSILKNNINLSSKEISIALRNELKKFNGNRAFDDDVGYLIVKT